MISNNNCHYVDRSDCSRPFQLSPPLSTMELADLLLQEVDALLVGAACRVTLLPRLLRDDKEELVASIEKDIGDARELLEQLELAGWEMDAKRRKRHQELVKTKGEAVTQLQKDYWRARISYRDVVSPWNEVLEEGAEEANLSEDLKVQLIENTVRLDSGTRMLEIACLACTETEQIGLDVTRHLQKDTEKLQLVRSHLQDTQRHLKCSKYVQNRIVNRKLCWTSQDAVTLDVNVEVSGGAQPHALATHRHDESPMTRG
ncbi:uncharacterized protein LOC133350604 isoform X2 [Lethenteron reissneri]|uniref:uncharacterized protein LOC133350604 isoform X2 n=1 Tax=Lethenteron reissneri TaxID=7753 RepID=UPI002AB64C9F|nr:uncharacterized protein LOC133350604 isoform X2 [Lethenteron reissneri]